MVESIIYDSTAMICHTCRRTEVVEFPSPAGQETGALRIYFDFCPVCSNRSIRHSTRFIDPKKFKDITDALMLYYQCIPIIRTERKFSLTALRVKHFVRIRYIDDIFGCFHSALIKKAHPDMFASREDVRFFLMKNKPSVLPDRHRLAPTCHRCLSGIIEDQPPVYALYDSNAEAKTPGGF